MPEEKKEKIIKVLKQFPDDKFSVTQLKEVMGDISYPTLLKWVLVLEAERRINVEDYGNVKIICLNKEYQDNE